MTTIKPDQVKSSVASFIEYRDLFFQNTGVNISNTAFDESTDRVYDVRTGASIGIAVQLTNVGGLGEALLFEIQSSNYASTSDDLSDIPDSSWSDLEPETSLPDDTTTAIFEFFRATPAITAIRIRLRVAAQSTPVTGIIGWF